MRDALSLLDQCAAATAGELNADSVYACLGIAGQQKAAEMMAYIARHETQKALSLFNRLYADGKDLGALLDELACLARDLLIVQTAPGAGLTMLSGVAEGREAAALAKMISGGELIRILSLLQQTLAGFTRSASRRMDAELCILNMCQPELSLDAQSLNARLTRLEEKIATGAFVAAKPNPAQTEPEAEEEELPPPPDDWDAPPEEVPQPVISEVPMGFWMDLAASIRQELPPPMKMFFTFAPGATVQASLQGDKVILQCQEAFTLGMINKPELLEIVARKASARLGRNIRAEAVDLSAQPAKNPKMDQLMSFSRAHSDVIKIKGE
jgi:DNA polymerase-3 subunit gamma/tau